MSRAVARVDEPGLEVAALDDLARQPLDAALPPRGVHGVRRRLAVRAARRARGSSSGRSSVCGTWSRAISGKYVSVRWIRNASSSARLLAQQRVAVVVDDRDRGEVERHGDRPDQYLKKWLLELERLVLLGVRGGLGAPDLEVLGRRGGAPRALVSTSSFSSSSSASLAVSGKRRMPAPRPLVVGQVAGILVDRLARVEPALDPVEGGGHHAAERDVRVGARVAGLQLEVRRAGLVVPVAGRDADRGLAVLDAPGGVRRAPVVRLEAAERVDAGRREPEQARAGGR